MHQQRELLPLGAPPAGGHHYQRSLLCPTQTHPMVTRVQLSSRLVQRESQALPCLASLRRSTQISQQGAMKEKERKTLEWEVESCTFRSLNQERLLFSICSAC